MTTPRRALWSWAFYDWANSAFATTVMAGFFPVFFKLYWAGDATATEGTFALGVANSVASLLVAVLSPILGAVADKGSYKKRFLALFTLLGALMTAGLWFVAQGDWAMAVVLYIGGSVGFFGSMVFYDSLLVTVAPRDKWDKASALGFGLGYLGGGLLFAVNVLMSQMPQVFGLADASEAVRWSFVIVGLWWLGFSVPLFLWVDEPREGGAKFVPALRAGWSQLIETLRSLRDQKTIVLFLLAYWFYIDGVDTIVKMSVNYGTDLGLDSSALIVALLLVQFIAFPAALGYQWVASKVGIKTSLLVGVGAYTAITIFAYFLVDVTGFFVLASCVGLVQGGIQALSRSAFARLVPPDKSGEYFGFFNMFGKFATIVGPFLMGLVTALSGSSRVGILSIIVLFVVGGGLLAFVKVPRA